MSLVIPGAPIPKPRMTRSDKWKKRPCVQRFFHYRDNVRLAMRKHPIPDMTTLDVIFYVAMPKSFSKAQRERMSGTPHNVKPDLDNFVKSILDCLYQEDCHISTIVAQKVWDDGMGPRTVVNL